MNAYFLHNIEKKNCRHNWYSIAHLHIFLARISLTTNKKKNQIKWVRSSPVLSGLNF